MKIKTSPPRNRNHCELDDADDAQIVKEQDRPRSEKVGRPHLNKRKAAKRAVSPEPTKTTDWQYRQSLVNFKKDEDWQSSKYTKDENDPLRLLDAPEANRVLMIQKCGVKPTDFKFAIARQRVRCFLPGRAERDEYGRFVLNSDGLLTYEACRRDGQAPIYQSIGSAYRGKLTGKWPIPPERALAIRLWHARLGIDSGAHQCFRTPLPLLTDSAFLRTLKDEIYVVHAVTQTYYLGLLQDCLREFAPKVYAIAGDFAPLSNAYRPDWIPAALMIETGSSNFVWWRLRKAGYVEMQKPAEPIEDDDGKRIKNAPGLYRINPEFAQKEHNLEEAREAAVNAWRKLQE